MTDNYRIPPFSENDMWHTTVEISKYWDKDPAINSYCNWLKDGPIYQDHAIDILYSLRATLKKYKTRGAE